MTRRSLPAAPPGLAIDPGDDLAREPRLLVDPRLLGALHAELGERLGPCDAAEALVQLGFLHGLRDALRVMRRGFADGAVATAPGSPLLAMRLESHGDARLPGGLELRGSWPERHEAAAHASTLGSGDAPVCHLSAGYTSGWLSGVFDAPLLATEVQCSACGAPQCRFVARDPAAWNDTPDPALAARAHRFPFAQLRALVEREPAPPAPSDADRFDPSAPVVHVWGPVMVLPFCGLDESMQAVELIGRDPAAREVAVVVVDLTGAVIDESFGALALERTLDAIEAWGAEPILAGVSPISERAVAELERAHLVLRKDLPQAIAAGFQIAQAQRRFL